MNLEDLEKTVFDLRALLVVATPGPWEWDGSCGRHLLRVVARVSMTPIVLEVKRWGFNGAWLWFADRKRGVMTPPRLVMRAAYDPHSIVGIDHPDARLLLAARNALPQLLEAAHLAQQLEAVRQRSIVQVPGSGFVDCRTCLSYWRADDREKHHEHCPWYEWDADVRPVIEGVAE